MNTMTKMITIALVLFGTHSAIAKETILSGREVVLPVDISSTSTRLSESDYPVPVVKVLVPELADVTVLNHRNTGEGAPCLATFDAWLPEQVIQDNPLVEQIDFTVSLIKSVLPNEKLQTCQVTLIEEVKAVIRGFNFIHTEQTQVESRHIDDCR